MGTCIASGESDSRVTLRKLAQGVVTSQHLYPTTQREVLLDDLEGIVTPPNDLSHSFQQMSARVATFDFAANFGLATLNSDWNRENMAQEKRRALFNLLVKH